MILGLLGPINADAILLIFLYQGFLFLAASSAQSSKKRYVVVVVGMDFQSQHLSKKKRKVALERISKWEEHIWRAGQQHGRTAERQ